VRHEGTVKIKGRIREEAGDIADCGLRIADLTAKNAARQSRYQRNKTADFQKGRTFCGWLKPILYQNSQHSEAASTMHFPAHFVYLYDKSAQVTCNE
jgi:hypothetical protein